MSDEICSFQVKALTDRQTDRQTDKQMNTDNNVTALAEVITQAHIPQFKKPSPHACYIYKHCYPLIK